MKCGLVLYKIFFFKKENNLELFFNLFNLRLHSQCNKGLAHLYFSMFIYVFFATEFENHIRFDVTYIVFYA